MNEMSVEKIIAQRSRALVQESGRTINDVADSIGVSYGAVTNWFYARRPSIWSLEKLAQEFGVPMEYFFTTDERAENILHGTPLRTDDAEVNRLREQLKDAVAKAEEYQEKADKLTAKIQLMTVELAHYRAEPQQASLDGSVIEAARKSVVASRSLLQATLDVLDEIGRGGNE